MWTEREMSVEGGDEVRSGGKAEGAGEAEGIAENFADEAEAGVAQRKQRRRPRGEMTRRKSHRWQWCRVHDQEESRWGDQREARRK